MCFISLFVLAQLLFGFNFLAKMFYDDQDFVDILIETAKENGYEYDEVQDVFIPE